LNWAYGIKPSQLLRDGGLLLSQEAANLKAWLRGGLSSAASPNYPPDYPPDTPQS